MPSDTSAGTRSPGLGRRLRRIALDLTPLRDRDFRLLWSGELLSEIGSNITLVAVYSRSYRLTDSPPRSG